MNSVDCVARIFGQLQRARPSFLLLGVYARPTYPTTYMRISEND